MDVRRDKHGLFITVPNYIYDIIVCKNDECKRKIMLPLVFNSRNLACINDVSRLYRDGIYVTLFNAEHPETYQYRHGVTVCTFRRPIVAKNVYELWVPKYRADHFHCNSWCQAGLTPKQYRLERKNRRNIFMKWLYSLDPSREDKCVLLYM
jgi:hypothetical protein